MRRFICLLLALALLSLCACGGKSPAPQPAAPSQQTAAPSQPAAAQQQASPMRQEVAAQPQLGDILPGFDPDLEMTEEEIAETELNDCGYPDLSRYTPEEIWEMLQNPQEDPNTLTPAEEALFYPELEDDARAEAGVTRTESDWRPFDPAGWVPEEHEADLGIDWDAIEAEMAAEMSDWDPEAEGMPDLEGIPELEGEMPDVQGILEAQGMLKALPQQYAFLLPEGLREGDMAFAEEGGLTASLPNRTEADYKAVVSRAKGAGFSQEAQEMDVMGMKMYTAQKGEQSITILLSGGSVMITVE